MLTKNLDIKYCFIIMECMTSYDQQSTSEYEECLSIRCSLNDYNFGNVGFWAGGIATVDGRVDWLEKKSAEWIG